MVFTDYLVRESGRVQSPTLSRDIKAFVANVNLKHRPKLFGRKVCVMKEKKNKYAAELLNKLVLQCVTPLIHEVKVKLCKGTICWFRLSIGTFLLSFLPHGSTFKQFLFF